MENKTNKMIAVTPEMHDKILAEAKKAGVKIGQAHVALIGFALRKLDAGEVSLAPVSIVESK